MEYFFISRIGTEVVGYVRAVADSPATLRITMSRLAVEWHHTSVPSSLLENVHDFCRRSGFSTVVVDAGAVPLAARRVLERCGFRPRTAQGRWGCSQLECEVTATASPVRKGRTGHNRAADEVSAAAGHEAAPRKPQRSRGRLVCSAECNSR